MEGWRECLLRDIVALQRGHDLPESVRNEGTVPVIGSFGITGWHDEAKVENPVLTVGRSGASFGTVYFYDGAAWPLNTCLYVTDFKGNTPKFLYYYLKNIDFTGFNSGSAQASLNRNFLYLLNCQVPLFTEQQAIAALLSSLDDKIDLLHRQNKTLEALAQTLFRQWFVEEADASWKEGTFFDEFDILMGQSPQGTTFNEIADGLPMFQGSADFGFRFPTNRIYTNSPIRIANVFDTLISVRAPVGDQNMARSRCCIGRGLSAIRYKKNPSYYNYTYYKVMSLLDKIKLYNDEGTVFGSISKSDFEKIPTIMPPESDIVSCELRLKNIDGKIVNNIDQINTLTKIRDTLLPKLMSGEVRVL